MQMVFCLSNRSLNLETGVHGFVILNSTHRRMSRGGHGLPKVSSGLAMSYPSTPCGWATPESSSARRAAGMRSSFTPLDTPRCTPMRLCDSQLHTVTQSLLILGFIEITEIQFELILKVTMTPCGRASLEFILKVTMTLCGQPSLDRLFGRSSDGCPQGIQWLGPGGA
jgi:hypothetical protein